MPTPPKKIRPIWKKISKILFLKFKFNRKNKTFCYPPLQKKSSPPPNFFYFSQFRFRLKTENWLKILLKNMSPLQKQIAPPKNYLFSISISSKNKKNDLRYNETPIWSSLVFVHNFLFQCLVSSTRGLFDKSKARTF